MSHEKQFLGIEGNPLWEIKRAGGANPLGPVILISAQDRFFA